LPTGRTSPTGIKHTREVEALAQRLLRDGYFFECEVLRTGELSLTIGSHDADEGDVACKVVKNEPNAPGQAVGEMIVEFCNAHYGTHAVAPDYKKWVNYKKWVK
jgi:hypothetical protein